MVAKYEILASSWRGFLLEKIKLTKALIKEKREE